MKRMTALILTAALAAGLALPASAAESQEERLAQVTQAVKDTLDLDTSAYDNFYGECYDQQLVSQWSLTWEGAEERLSIDALEDGTVIWYSLSRTEGAETGLPGYPGGDAAQAREAAQAFLAQVLDPELETAVLEETGSSKQLGRDEFRFSGDILFHGLPSPLSCSVTVDGESGQVTRFSRDISYGLYMGDVPGHTPAVDSAAAAQSLKGSLSLKLEYVLSEEDETQAVLRYVPDGRDEYYVDAQTGELVNLTELEEELLDGGIGTGGSAAGDSSAESAPSSPSLENGLSQAEQEGIQKLEGVLSKETLDGQLRAVAQYGLEDYALSSASYRLIEETEAREEQVLCTLRYLLPGEDGTASRTFTVDARTGQVEDLWSALPWEEGQTPQLTQAEAQAKAEAFLESFCPGQAAKLALYAAPGPEKEIRAKYTFTFARQENGYFFPDHFYEVAVSAQDGSVCGLSYLYEEDVAFDSPEGIISNEKALDAWMDTYTVTLGYLQVPEKLSAGDPEAAPYLQLGLKAFYVLKLGYGLEREDYLYGIDAKTGTPVRPERGTDGGLAYSDLSGHWARETVEALAAYHVGYEGGTFAPGQAMTQFDLVALLFSVENYPLDPAAATEEERDAAYSAAYRMGALTPAERSDSAPLTRSGAVKLLLNAEGLKNAAGLAGIYTCTYTDRDSIPAEDLGYAALAQGIGMAGDTWAGSRTATRAEGAVMLHKLLAW